MKKNIEGDENKQISLSTQKYMEMFWNEKAYIYILPFLDRPDILKL